MDKRIRGYIEWQLEHYHENKRAVADLKLDLMPAIVGNSEGNGGQSGPSDTTADAALRIMSNAYIVKTERETAIIERTLERAEEADKRLIAAVYWGKRRSVECACGECGLERSTAYRHINAILRDIAVSMGYTM